MIPILGFTPDLPETTPGALFSVAGLVPTQKGLRAGPDTVPNAAYTLTAECRGSAMVVNMSGVSKLYAGTASKLYEQSGGTWTDRSGAAYALGSNRWSFAQFGEDTLAVAITETLQKATTGSFAAVAGAPKAEIVLVAKGFVMLLHTNEGTFGDQADRWWCSAYLDDTDWTPAVSTQCTTGRLIEGDGPITGGAVLGDDIIVTKKNALFHGRYVGPPVVWEFTRIRGNYGASGKNAIASLGDRLAIASHDDIYLYDGNTIQSIAAGKVKDWYSAAANADGVAYRTTVVYDKANSTIWVHLFELLSTTWTVNALVYHTVSGLWGLHSSDRMEEVTTFPSAVSAGYMFSDSHVLHQLDYTANTNSGFQSWTAGDEDSDSHLSKIDLRLLSSPTTATATPKYKEVLGDSFTNGSSSSIDDGTFDVRQSARWHAAAVNMTGPAEFTAIRLRIKPEGSR